LSGASYEAAEKSEWRMALKILREAKLFAKTFSNHEFGDASRGHSPNLYLKKN
jgi:hypothetical protein